MDKLSKDVLCLIALKLKGRDISSFCNTSKRITELISRNEMFWINKILKERPNFLSTFKDKVKLLDYKRLYNRLSVCNDKIYSVYFNKKVLHVKGKLKNYLEEDDIYYESVGKFVGDKFGSENWSIISGKNNVMVVVSSIKDILNIINLNFKSDENVNEEELYQCCQNLRDNPSLILHIENDTGFDMRIEKIEVL